jgi:PTS hybrid protein
VIGIVLVSHSAALADGLADMADQIAGGEVRIVAAGGGPDGTLGTRGDVIVEAIGEADTGNGVLVLADLGSAILSVKAALASGDMDGTRAQLADAPLVEGAIAAAVAASIGQDLDAVRAAAEEAWSVRKL